MGSDALHNEEVRVDDGEQRQEVAEDGVDEDVAAVHGVLAQVVGAAGGHVALRGVLAPSEHGCQGPHKREGPHEGVAHHCSLDGEGSASQSLDDDVVPVQCNHSHGPDGSATEEGAEHAVDFAHGGSCK